MEICPICLEPCNEDKIEVKGCMHIFHEDCIEEWYVSSNTISCPVCRRAHPDGCDMLVNLWCKLSFDQLSFIKYCLIRTHFTNIEYAFRRQDLICWSPFCDESLEEAMLRLLPCANDSLKWIKCFSFYTIQRFTRSVARNLEVKLNVIQTIISDLRRDPTIVNARRLFVFCQLLFAWGCKSKIWSQHLTLRIT